MKQFAINPEQWLHANDEAVFSLPVSLGQGRITTKKFSSGFQLFIADYRLHEPTCMEYPTIPSVYGFGFCLSGKILCHPYVFTKEFSIASPQSAFFHFPEQDKQKETISTDRTIRINITLTPEHLYDSVFPQEFSQNLGKMIGRAYRTINIITPAMQQALLSILQCPYQGLARQFFLEAKVMELIAYKLDQVFYENGKYRQWSDSILCDEDIDRMKQVANTITQQLDLPLNLQALAKNVGVCRSKLHKCFKQVYGVTPFEFARSKRFEKAKQLLQQGENVTQTAFYLGYSSPSHFTKAFKQYFGYLPLQCRKK